MPLDPSLSYCRRLLPLEVRTQCNNRKRPILITVRKRNVVCLAVYAGRSRWLGFWEWSTTSLNDSFFNRIAPNEVENIFADKCAAMNGVDQRGWMVDRTLLLSTVLPVVRLDCWPISENREPMDPSSWQRRFRRLAGDTKEEKELPDNYIRCMDSIWRWIADTNKQLAERCCCPSHSSKNEQ